MYQLSSASGQSGTWSTDPARHLAEQIRRQRTCLSGDGLRVVQASVSRNSYVAHPEIIMLAILGDENPSVRADAMELVLDM